MALYVACGCGRAVEVPEDFAADAIHCPDCGRRLPLDGGPAGAPPAEPPRQALPDYSGVVVFVTFVALLIMFPGVAKVVGVGFGVCCVAPLLGVAFAAWWNIRRMRQFHAEQMRQWREGQPPPP